MQGQAYHRLAGRATGKLASAGMQRLAFGFAFGLLAALLAGGPVSAQNWPQRTVKLIVTLGAGSGVDIGARLLAERLSRRWGQPGCRHSRGTHDC
jgi:tripartite-type tricarboxylate transporter receptor subunit TctC